MLGFFARRLVQAILTILGVLTVAFFLVRLSGDPTALLLPEAASVQDMVALRAELGLDRPIWVQYSVFLSKAVQGDFGNSLRLEASALGLVLERVPATLELTLTAFVLGITLAFAGALTMRLSTNQRLRSVLLWIAFTRQAIPVFWFGLLLIILFSVVLRWLPSVGRGGIEHLVLPAVTLATFEIALYLRLLDAAFGEQERQDYVRTAYAKGQTRVKIVLRHMLPNALLPLVTIAGVNLGILLGGTVVTETVFSWPGMGRLIVQAVSQRDYPVVMAGVVVASFMFVAINFTVDMLYGILDPRIRYR
ncbi:MAG: ABC transporter permease [Proteobacteria bacterium]|nr:ABC transporter permease [Pseudomonadota bacterium]